MSDFEYAEQDRQIANLIRFGLIESVDPPGKRLKVRSGEAVTGWLPWPAEIGRNFIRWRPLREGTQVILASPSGDLAQAAIIGMLYTETLDAPGDSDPDLDLIQFSNGALLRHNATTGEMALQSQGELRLTVKGNVAIENEGDMTLKSQGKLSLDAGKDLLLKAGGDVRINASNVRVFE